VKVINWIGSKVAAFVAAVFSFVGLILALARGLPVSAFLALVAIVAFGGLASNARAQTTTPTFDYTGYVTTLTSGAGAVATVAGLLAAVLVGVVVFRALIKYFKKGGG
jgi:hypothetical protein